MSDDSRDATGAHHQRVKQIFLDALDAPRGRRAAVVSAACEGDEVLRREVLELFLLHGEADSVLDAPLDGSDALADFARSSETQLGPFRLLRELGRGGMGVVYLAERDGQLVALKLLAAGSLSPELRERFRLEGEILRRLDHPGLARVLEVGDSAGPGCVPQPWIAMEHVDGRPLLQFAEESALPPEGRLRLMAAVCDAVHHAHAHGVVHRDLKPGNILVREDGRPVVLDFGVARLVAGDERPTELATRTGQMVGTPQYMSPEQVQAEPAGVGPESDVYSLGVILYELLTGRVPYEASSVSLHRAIISILTSDPVPLGQVAPELRGATERIVAMALEKEPRHRYADAGALGDDLRRRIEGRTVRAKGPSLARRMVRWSRRRQRLAAAVAALVVGAALLGAWVLGGGRTVPRERVLAAYREAETLVTESTTLLYERERTAESLRQVIARLTQARTLVGEVPPLSHRNVLVRMIEKDLGTAQWLLGELAWDVGAARQAVVTLEHALNTPLDTAQSALRDRQVIQIGHGRVSNMELYGLLAGARLCAYRLWGEDDPLRGAHYLARLALREHLEAMADPKVEGSTHQTLRHYLGYAYNSLAEIGSELARFRQRPEAARQATAWSDSAYVRREAFSQDWPAYGSLLFERGRAFLALGEVTRSRAALDSAERYLHACSDYRGRERPRIHAETRETLARLALTRSGLEPEAARRVRLLLASLHELDTAHRVLSRTSAPPAHLAWLRSSRVEPLVQLALATGRHAWLDSAQSVLEETRESFPPTSLPRHASVQWLRQGMVKFARHSLQGSPLDLQSARGDLAYARSLALVRRDSLVLAMIERADRPSRR